MANLVNVLLVYDELYKRAPQPLTTRQLAEATSLPERTVQHYIFLLRELGFPIKAKLGKGGGHQLLPTFPELAPLAEATTKQQQRIARRMEALTILRFFTKNCV